MVILLPQRLIGLRAGRIFSSLQALICTFNPIAELSFGKVTSFLRRIDFFVMDLIYFCYSEYLC